MRITKKDIRRTIGWTFFAYTLFLVALIINGSYLFSIGILTYTPLRDITLLALGVITFGLIWAAYEQAGR